MAISPPSDIVLDVAKAADPVKLQTAAEKLARIANGEAGAADFAKMLEAARTGASGTAAVTAAPGPSPSAVLAALQRSSTHATRQAVGTDNAQMKAFKGLEAVFLQTYVEAMMPRNEGFFGDAASGQICKTFLAQELATQLAESGSIGLAKSLFAAHPPGGGTGAAAAEALSAGGAARQAQALSTSAAATNAGTLSGLMAGGRWSSRRS